MTEEQSEERTVRCPLEGCTREILARGINLHIRQSSDDIHGPQGEIPKGVNFDELETVGKEPVQVDYPEERNDDPRHILCPFCYGMFKGERGIQTHLSQKSGEGNHPDDAAERYDIEEMSLQGEENTSERQYSANIAKHYINQLLAEGEIEEAKRAKRFLLDQPE